MAVSIRGVVSLPSGMLTGHAWDPLWCAWPYSHPMETSDHTSLCVAALLRLSDICMPCICDILTSAPRNPADGGCSLLISRGMILVAIGDGTQQIHHTPHYRRSELELQPRGFLDVIGTPGLGKERMIVCCQAIIVWASLRSVSTRKSCRHIGRREGGVSFVVCATMNVYQSVLIVIMQHLLSANRAACQPTFSKPWGRASLMVPQGASVCSNRQFVARRIRRRL